MIEVNKIDEMFSAHQGFDTRGIELPKTKGKQCIYLQGKICSAPKMQFKICRGCPKAQQFIKQNVVKKLFSKIKGLAIMMMSMGNSFGSGTGVGSGGGSAAGGGGGK